MNLFVGLYKRTLIATLDTYLRGALVDMAPGWTREKKKLLVYPDSSSTPAPRFFIW